MAGSVAEDGTGTAGQGGNLNGILRLLVPSHESAVRMCCPPYAYDPRTGEGGQVHVGTVHGEHGVEVAHEDEFLFQSFKGIGNA